MLLGLLRPTRGSATVLGEDSRGLSPPVRDRIGYVAEGHRLYRSMTIKGIASFNRRFFSRWDQNYFDEMMRHFGAEPTKRVRQLSSGQRAQLSLALALATRPDLLIMDDPTMGVDAVVRRQFLESMIRLISEAGRTVLFSSHVLSDVERVADRIGIIRDGVLRVDCTLDEFKHQVRQVRVRFDRDVPPLDTVERMVTARIEKTEAILTVVNFDGRHEEVLRSLGAVEIEPMDSALEDLFIDYSVRGTTDFSPLRR
jgi:ABC-2 type transport system ATP-binding protein